ncbi:RRQRL motif-containing zinc-binding protein [Amycolatopsis nigrescens]|uniref:RRQRL motif-containing zinc-binding protein n=1 Tax=Amycolatopsis nigrescens TaxID=381445 RepID=UPI00036DF6B9|nr:RRQRL motif-containing zinc-binding protein [Amycolatopsis nigrescens]
MVELHGKRAWDLRPVPWSDLREYTRGLADDGTILLSYGTGPRDKLATKRQLRAMGLRPGGQDPVAVLYFRCRKACRLTFANLYLVEKALPVRPMTPARQAALDKAMAARRTCRECGETGYAELPKAGRTCEPCRYTLGLLDPLDYLHDFLAGESTFGPAGHAALERDLTCGLAAVIPIHRPRRTSGTHTHRTEVRSA